MAFKNFRDFLSRTIYEEAPAPEAEIAGPTPEEMATFEAAMSAENGENVTEEAQAIIAGSQVESDNDEYPDISNVQTALETAGSGENHELIRRILVTYAGCNPDDLEKDGVKRRQAIEAAIEHTRQQAATLKADKADEEEALSQAERDAEAACTAAITDANVACEEAIEEEKRRSAAIIAEIRQKAEDATAAAKQQRDETLKTLSAQRAENEAVLRNSAALVAETEKQGKIVVAQIDEWLSYLK